MARPKEFDRERVLDKAMQLFWRQGYEATSMQDLVAGMGINRASLYDTFGDKHALYLAVLEKYVAFSDCNLQRVLEETPSARQAIVEVFEGILQEEAAGERKGCLVVNSTVELANTDQQVAERVACTMARNQELFQAAVERGQANGEIAARHNAQALARFLVSSMAGLRVTAKTTTDQNILRSIVEVTLAALD